MEKLEAVVEEIVFRNEENGFTVLQVRVGRQKVSAVGVMPMIAPGEQVIIEGEWGEHPQYGKQIKIATIEALRPTTRTGIERYLASGLIKGIGPATARQIVHEFGVRALDVLQYEPEKLREIPGIGPKRVQMIAASFQEQQQMREAMVFLQSYQIPPALAIKIFKAYGEQTTTILRQNPYRLVADIEGVGFRTADRIALSLGFAAEDDARLNAGVMYALSDAAMSGGHTYLPKELLLQTAGRLLGAPEELIERALTQLLLTQALAAQDLDAHTAIYLPTYLAAEREVARRLRECIANAPEGAAVKDAETAVARFESCEQIDFDEQQRQAVLAAVRSGCMVITGGPGTGKTTIIRCILHLLSRKGTVLLAAPTGRAAKRMSEATGVEAKTLHRLLEYGGDDGHFERDEEHPLDTDTLIVDEMSMVDLFLMRSLLRALPKGARLLLVGDADQLPSVGPGNVLRDVIDSGCIPTARLTNIYRQDEHSMIVTNAHRINHGEMPVLNGKGSDFFLERRNSHADAATTIVSLCQTRLPAFLHVDALRQIQVLSPMKKGESGVFALNAMLQRALNPPRDCVQERVHGDVTFREGDKVMQTRNDYSMEWTRGREEGTGVFNGDMGMIARINVEEETVTVRFDDDREADYENADLDDLDLAYCVSVHKSQGSEFPVVVMPVMGGPQMLLTRNLFYTAVTRARRMVVLVGREDAVRAMVENVHINRRYSALAMRIQAI